MLVTVNRVAVVGNATLGMLHIEGLRPLWTLEDLWNGNKINGRIPAGTYTCTPHGWSGEPVRFAKVWEVKDVPNRKAILFHALNTAEQTLGCIGVGCGVSRGTLVSSRAAINDMRSFIGPNPFTLVVKDIPGWTAP